jgi:hypothetical protein
LPAWLQSTQWQAGIDCSWAYWAWHAIIFNSAMKQNHLIIIIIPSSHSINAIGKTTS